MNIIDLVRRTNLKPATGRLLIADPQLSDPSFARTVVLLCEHGPEGSIGFVLNRPSSNNIGDFVPELYNPEIQVFEGGPVQLDTMHMLHCIPDVLGGVAVDDNLCWGGDYNNLSSIVHNAEFSANTIRLFIGYAGWEPDQLEAELEQGSWLVSGNFNNELIFDTKPEDMWRRCIQALGPEFAYLINIPLHPQFN